MQSDTEITDFWASGRLCSLKNKLALLLSCWISECMGFCKRGWKGIIWVVMPVVDHPWAPWLALVQPQTYRQSKTQTNTQTNIESTMMWVVDHPQAPWLALSLNTTVSFFCLSSWMLSFPSRKLRNTFRFVEAVRRDWMWIANCKPVRIRLERYLAKATFKGRTRCCTLPSQGVSCLAEGGKSCTVQPQGVSCLAQPPIKGWKKLQSTTTGGVWRVRLAGKISLSSSRLATGPCGKRCIFLNVRSLICLSFLIQSYSSAAKTKGKLLEISWFLGGQPFLIYDPIWAVFGPPRVLQVQ